MTPTPHHARAQHRPQPRPHGGHKHVQGANQAAAAGRLGTRTVMVGQVGSDAGGPYLCAALNAAGVVTDGSVVAVDGAATGTAVVMVLPDGENSIVIVGGANAAPFEPQEAQRQAVADASIVLLQRELPDAVNLQFARVRAPADASIVLLQRESPDAVNLQFARVRAPARGLAPNACRGTGQGGQPENSVGSDSVRPLSSLPRLSSERTDAERCLAAPTLPVCSW